MPNKSQTPVQFSAVLDALFDLTQPFPALYLHQFSDLTPALSSQLRKVWPGIDLERRRALLSDLGEMAENDTLITFKEIGRLALDDPDPQARALGIRLLWEAEDIRLIPIFIRMLEQDPDVNVRATAANGLGAYVFLGEIEDLPHDLLGSIEESLFKAYSGSDQTLVRRKTLESLGYSSRPEVPGLIKKAYNADSSEWLESALFAMGRSADQSWGPAVLKSIDHANPTIQYEAVRAAGELQLEGARQPLLDLLEESADDNCVRAAIWSLSQIGGDGVRPALEKLLDELEDDEEISIIEEALDNLTFTEDMAIFDLVDMEIGDDPDMMIDLDQPSSPEDDDNLTNQKPGIH